MSDPNRADPIGAPRSIAWPVAAVITALVAVVVVRSAWASDDSYITMRTVDNFVHGYGLRWNVVERVQTYTHPLWMFTLSAFYFFTRNAFLTPIALGVTSTIATVWLLSRKVAATPFIAFAGAVILISSRSFIDYSTSGLENSLTHLLLVVFALAAHAKWRQPLMSNLWIYLVASGLVLNRMDLGVLVGPVVGVLVFADLRHRRFVDILKGFSPIALWLAFSTFYYGFPFPNTAYAKLNTSIESSALWAQGWLYVVDVFTFDLVTPLVIVGGLILGFARGWRALEFSFAVGIALYCFYVVRVGGDFMSGRFWTAPFVIALVMLVRRRWRWDFVSVSVVVAAVMLVSTTSARGIPLLSGRDAGLQQQAQLIGPSGIADERAYYFPYTGLLRTGELISTDTNFPGAKQRVGYKWDATSPKVLVAVGAAGYAAGPEIHIVDCVGLADPLLARLPSLEPWRIGHFRREIPSGYTEWVTSGEGAIDTRGIARFNDVLASITRGKLLNPSRLGRIVKMNFGAYSSWLDGDYVSQPSRCDGFEGD